MAGDIEGAICDSCGTKIGPHGCCGDQSRFDAARADERGLERQQHALMIARVEDLEEVVRLLVFHVGNKLTDPEAQEELDQASLGTPMQRV